MPNDIYIHSNLRLQQGFLMSLTSRGRAWILETFYGVQVTSKEAIFTFKLEHLPEILIKIKEDPTITYDD